MINTISAILAQQTRQIGMMKAVGARDRQVAGIYLGIVIAYALLALPSRSRSARSGRGR